MIEYNFQCMNVSALYRSDVWAPMTGLQSLLESSLNRRRSRLTPSEESSLKGVESENNSGTDGSIVIDKEQYLVIKDGNEMNFPRKEQHQGSISGYLSSIIILY